MSETVVIPCPGCGAIVPADKDECEWCHRPVMVRSYQSVDRMSPLDLNKYASVYRQSLIAHPENSGISNSLGICFLKMKQYDNARNCFQQCIMNDPSCAEYYFYLSVCMLKGRKPFLLQRSEINEIEQNINTAMMLSPDPLYTYFWALIRYDYHKRKFFNVTPDYNDLLHQSIRDGVSILQTDALYAMLNMERPACFTV